MIVAGYIRGGNDRGSTYGLRHRGTVRGHSTKPAPDRHMTEGRDGGHEEKHIIHRLYRDEHCRTAANGYTSLRSRVPAH
jgi:hypothetical protein